MTTIQTEREMRKLFTELQPGEQIEVTHEVKVGRQIWNTKTVGKVVKTERRRHGLHNKRAADDWVGSDIIILQREDGELTTVTIDEFSQLRRIAS